MHDLLLNSIVFQDNHESISDYRNTVSWFTWKKNDIELINIQSIDNYFKVFTVLFVTLLLFSLRRPITINLLATAPAQLTGTAPNPFLVLRIMSHVSSV